jgi:hypothetical protein
MKHNIPFPIIFLPLLFCILAGTSVMAKISTSPAQKIRIFYSNNVHAELGPCG